MTAEERARAAWARGEPVEAPVERPRRPPTVPRVHRSARRLDERGNVCGCGCGRPLVYTGTGRPPTFATPACRTAVARILRETACRPSLVVARLVARLVERGPLREWNLDAVARGMVDEAIPDATTPDYRAFVCLAMRDERLHDLGQRRRNALVLANFGGRPDRGGASKRSDR